MATGDGNAQTGVQSQNISAGAACAIVNRGLDGGGHYFEAGKDYEGYVFVKGFTPGLSLEVNLEDWSVGTSQATSIGKTVIPLNTAATAAAHFATGWQMFNFTVIANASTSCKDYRVDATSYPSSTSTY